MRQRSGDQDNRNITVIRPDLPHRRPALQRKKIPEIARAGICVVLSIVGVWICTTYLNEHYLDRYVSAKSTYYNLVLVASVISMVMTMAYGAWFVYILLNGDSEYRAAQAQRLKEENQKADEEQNREHRRLMNIAGAEDTWSCDDILIRLRELQRYQKRYYPFRTQFQKAAQDSENPEAALAGFLHGFAPADPRADELSDTIFRLERIAKRRNCHDDNAASPATIIGFERD